MASTPSPIIYNTVGLGICTKRVLVEKEAYLFGSPRYIVLNPVRAQMVKLAKNWSWSSYRAIAGLSAIPGWLTTDWLLGDFGDNKQSAQQAYRSDHYILKFLTIWR